MLSSPCREPTRQRLWARKSSSCSRHLPTCWGATMTTSVPSNVRITPTSTPAGSRAPCTARTGSGTTFCSAGDAGPATGWFSRGQRLLERDGRDCAERGYLLIPDLVAHAIAGEHEAGYATATEVAEIGDALRDEDLIAIGVHEQGHALVRQGHFEEGVRLLDEVMVTVTTGELSPIVAGIVYCNTIGFWQSVYEFRRAREWTDALTRWCEQQPDMVAHTGVCLVHRAEIMQLQGAWEAALEEARRAGERFVRGSAKRTGLREGLLPTGRGPPTSRRASAAEEAYGRQVDVGSSRSQAWHCCAWRRESAMPRRRRSGGCWTRPRALQRVRRCFRRTSRSCLPPARSRRRAAPAASSRRSPRSPERHAPSDVRAGARSDGIGRRRAPHGSGGAACGVAGMAGARGTLRGRTRASSRGAGLPGAGDEDTAVWELDAARGVFDRAGGGSRRFARGLTRASARAAAAHGLTQRELQVLRLVAGGATNRSIAAELVLSERTIDRHVSNIFAKLRSHRERRPLRTPTSTTSSDPLMWVEAPTPPARASWVVQPKRGPRLRCRLS